MKENSSGGMRYWTRALRPLSWWVIFVLTLYGIHLHQRLIRETRIDFSVRAHELSFSLPTVTLDGKPVTSGQNIALGNHKFVATCQYNDPYEIDFFAWYGPHSLGDITLRHGIGTLHIHSEPPASKIHLVRRPVQINSTQIFSIILTNISDTNLMLSAGMYDAKASHLDDERFATVIVNSAQLPSDTLLLHFSSPPTNQIVK